MRTKTVPAFTVSASSIPSITKKLKNPKRSNQKSKKNIQYNGQLKRGERTNNDQQNTRKKTQNWVTRTPT